MHLQNLSKNTASTSKTLLITMILGFSFTLLSGCNTTDSTVSTERSTQKVLQIGEETMPPAEINQVQPTSINNKTLSKKAGDFNLLEFVTKLLVMHFKK